MIDKQLLRIERLPDNFFANLESRDVALWVRDLGGSSPDLDSLASFLGLPWRFVLIDSYHKELIAKVEETASLDGPLSRKRGFIQIIDSDPSRIELPERSLPIYLLSGRRPADAPQDFGSRLRRMAMLDGLMRSGVRDLLVLGGGDEPIPSEFEDLWASGFRSYATFVSHGHSAERQLRSWLDTAGPGTNANLLQLAPAELISDVLSRYGATYPEDRRVIRVRDRQGAFQRLDVTEADDPQRPLLKYYTLIEERDLSPITPEELSESDFIGFFRNPEESWRPYAAGLPWIRNSSYRSELRKILQKLDAVGSDENCVAYIAAESGAGGTTLSRWLAWECAREGYPTLLAKSVPFVPHALPLANYVNRIGAAFGKSKDAQASDMAESPESKNQDHKISATRSMYEAPWVVVFDELHWQNRDDELVRFEREMEKSGRPVCLLVVTGSRLGIAFHTSRTFKKIGELGHAIDQDDAQALGRHLNQFLRVFNKERPDFEWERFYKDHSVKYAEGIAMFWVSLSFWIQGQYDLSESIQEWVYRAFKQFAHDGVIQNAILEIAALSTERLPLPEGLLPPNVGKWPVSHLLNDARTDFAALGLIRIAADGSHYWALVHDILGRFLLNALFNDSEERNRLGFGFARDPEHLRFLLLRQVSQKSALGEIEYRKLGEDFAVSILKIDPDHGRNSLAPLWREVLDALDHMPSLLRDASRAFRHHTAISRRRIAKLDEALFGVTLDDKIRILGTAIFDIRYALTSIRQLPNSEPNLNLFNSLANAYFDLGEAERKRGATQERLSELRRLANEATRNAFNESPTNTFVVETYVKNLLQSVEYSPADGTEQCVEALGTIFAALTSSEVLYRTPQLGVLADRALALLFRQTASAEQISEPKNAIDVLINAWKALADQETHRIGGVLADIPEENRNAALSLLDHSAGKGNLQVIRLKLDLVCIGQPRDFKKQLEYVEQLQATSYRLSPQLRLEYAALLFQNDRPADGNREFRLLRQLWKETEYFVQVPDRLHWLIGPDGWSRRVVHAITGSDFGSRGMARVQEFGNILVPFRIEEFGIRNLRPGAALGGCHVTFGHNGPFLRPVTAGAHIAFT